MRRKSPEVRRADDLFGVVGDGLSDASGGLGLVGAPAVDVESAIATLEPLVTDERRERLHEVIGQRLASVTVVMDDPYDPHNGAAVLRSCDAFGVQVLHVIERRQPFAVATTVSRGSQKWVDVVRHRAVEGLLAALTASGHEPIATVADGDLEPVDLATIARPAIVLGNERSGIAAELRARCRRAVRVPMRGFAESLNVSVCAAILLASATSGRVGDLSPSERRRLYARGLFLSIPRAKEILAATML